MVTFKKIITFLTNPKNTRMLIFAGIVILILLFLRQCGKTNDAKLETEQAKQEIVRVKNNLIASKDTLRQYQFDNNTIRAEKLGYELTIAELSTEYSELLGDFEVIKNKPLKTIIKTVYEIRERIINVPVYVITGDNLYNRYLVFSDSVNYDSLRINYRYLTGTIPFNYNYLDSTIIPGFATFDLNIGMNLNVALFKDKKTKQVSIKADTDYPGITFTRLDGALIMDDPESRKVIRQMRKQWGLGLNVGYGAMYNNANIIRGPYIGVGLNYTPKFLQW